MAAAWFLRKGGMETVIFEQSEALGGAVRTLIPDTRISRETIEKDASFLWALGVTARFKTTITSLEELKTATDLLCICVRMATVEQLLREG